MKIRDFDAFGERATDRRWLATNQPPHLRACVNAIVAYAQEADAQAARLGRLAVALKSPELLGKSYALEHKARMADYLLGLA